MIYNTHCERLEFLRPWLAMATSPRRVNLSRCDWEVSYWLMRAERALYTCVNSSSNSPSS